MTSVGIYANAEDLKLKSLLDRSYLVSYTFRMADSFYLKCLKQELQRRRQKNPRYSLRAFAKSLNLDAGSISRILSGKLELSLNAAVRACANLKMDAETQRLFLASLADRRRELAEDKLKRGAHLLTLGPVPRQVESEQLAQIGHPAVLGLAETGFLESYQHDPAWLAKKVGLTIEETKEGLAKLVSLGLLREENGRWLKTEAHLTTGNKDRTNSALISFQKKILERAQHSLERDPIERRNMTGIVLALDPDRIPEAKRRILRFMGELCDFLESGPRKEIYQLAIQLFPLGT